MSWYADTSVLIPYYVPEPLSERVAAIFRRAPELLCSALVEVEMASAVSRKVRMGELSKRDGRRVLGLFGEHLTEGLFRRVFIESSHFVRARGWLETFETSLRTLDALHLACASAHAGTLLTADAKLAKAARVLGIPMRRVG